MLKQQIEIVNKLGLHARAAAKLVRTAAAFGSRVELEFSGQTADAKSIMSVMMLAAAQGSHIDISCDGQDEQAAMGALINLIEDYFGEEE
jgi:phosphocarrier protein HPr